MAVNLIRERSGENEEDYKLTISTWGSRKIIPSLKKMWEGTPAFFDGLQIATLLAPPLAYLANSFASVSLGYCSVE